MSWDHLDSICGMVFGSAGLFFSGLGFWWSVRVGRAQTAIEITKLHREFWTRHEEHPELAGLFEESRDLVARPLTSKEVREANFLFLHIRASYLAEKGGIYVQPERLDDDIRSIFSCPAARSAWDKVRSFHDRDFVAFMETCLSD